MGASAIHARRREIRRAFGNEAVEALQDHEDRIGQQATGINGLMVALQAQQKRITALEERASVLQRGFWGRLRWIFRGAA